MLQLDTHAIANFLPKKKYTKSKLSGGKTLRYLNMRMYIHVKRYSVYLQSGSQAVTSALIDGYTCHVSG